MLFSETSRFELPCRFRSEGAELGELFTFVSGLYFRGKLAYAQAFANPPDGVPGVLAITSSRGLVAPERVFSRADLMEMSGVPIEENEFGIESRFAGMRGSWRRGLGRIAGLCCWVALPARSTLRPWLKSSAAGCYFLRSLLGEGI